LKDPSKVSLYGETIHIIPTPSSLPILKLNVRHLFPSTTPSHTYSEFEFKIPDQTPNLLSAIDLMVSMKRKLDEVDGVEEHGDSGKKQRSGRRT
jgi:hypothetical protein